MSNWVTITTPPVPRPDRNAVADWTVAHLLELVFNGGLSPGDLLTELDLTERLGVSRSPVRYALQELEHSGLVDVDPVNGRRTLRVFGEGDIAESYDIRCDLEAMAARYAARSRDEAALQRVSEAFDAMVAALREPLDVWLPIDFAFHAAIAAASGTHRLPYMLGSVLVQHQAFLRRMDRGGVDPSTREQRLDTLPKHERIVTAIRAHDPDGSDAAVRRLLVERRDLMLDRFLAMGLGTV